MRHSLRGFIGILLILLVSSAYAQDTGIAVQSPPPAFQLTNVGYEAQGWNNCGPATLTNGLTYFGYTNNQTRAANWLKPNGEDKNVSPWQMAEFVNTQVTELPVQALVRYGGTEDLLKQLIANEFPVIIEAGYDPEPDRLGWMGHYLLVTGYDDTSRQFTTQDSYIGPNTAYSYDHVNEFWRHFNHTYIVLYEQAREAELMAVLGDNADEAMSIQHALEQAVGDWQINENDSWAWLNMATNLTKMGRYNEAAEYFDRAREIGIPWRVPWYQFDMFEAYYQSGRYEDVLEIARQNLNDGGGHFVEETYYYGGLAREAQGQYDRALSNYNEAIRFNPNFTPAVEARDRLQAQL